MRVVAIGFALVVVIPGCGKEAPEGPVSAPAASSASPAPRARQPSIAVPSASAPSSRLADEMATRLEAHFAQYREGASFDFLRSDFAPRVERYVSLTNVPVETLVRQAKAFYGQKKRIALAPNRGTIRLRGDGDRTVATFVLRMAWSQEPPLAQRACASFNDGMQLQPGSMIQRSVSVNAEMTVDASGRFVAYVERGTVPVRYRATSMGDPLVGFPTLPVGPARNAPAPPGALHVGTGTVVDDEGESFTCGVGSEVDTVRRVRVSGQPVWLLSDWASNTGRSWVGENALALIIEDAGR